MRRQLSMLLLVFCCLQAGAQDTASVDGLFRRARDMAFEQKDYPEAVRLARKALGISPGYTDIKVFIGRVYSWTKQPDSARAYFESALAADPGNEDAFLAYADLEYWHHRYEVSLALAERGLQHHPSSQALLLKKAKALQALRRYREAAFAVNQVLALNGRNPEARALAGQISDAAAANRVGLSYDYTGFDKQFADPWHIASLDYSRQTRYGSMAFRINYGNRFRQGGLQYEMDLYPRINKTFYTYLSLGYSNDATVFPRYRGGVSLFINLPRSFEAEIGTRYLYFSSPNWIYTLYLGKYYQRFLFGARAYLAPSSNRMSQSYNLSARYYYSGADDHLQLTIGTGISPDERHSTLLLNSIYKLSSQRISLGWKKSFGALNSVSLNAGWVNSEFKPGLRGNQYNLGLGYSRKF